MTDETERQWLEGEDARTQEDLREDREIGSRPVYEPAHGYAEPTTTEILKNIHEAIEGITQQATIAAVAAAEFKSLRDYQLIQITLLMRLYDVQMALLSVSDKGLADAVWDAHDRGDLMHPQLLVPELGEAKLERPADAGEAQPERPTGGNG